MQNQSTRTEVRERPAAVKILDLPLWIANRSQQADYVTIQFYNSVTFVVQV